MLKCWNILSSKFRFFLLNSVNIHWIICDLGNGSSRWRKMRQSCQLLFPCGISRMCMIKRAPVQNPKSLWNSMHAETRAFVCCLLMKPSGRCNWEFRASIFLLVQSHSLRLSHGCEESYWVTRSANYGDADYMFSRISAELHLIFDCSNFTAVISKAYKRLRPFSISTIQTTVPVPHCSWSVDPSCASLLKQHYTWWLYRQHGLVCNGSAARRAETFRFSSFLENMSSGENIHKAFWEIIIAVVWDISCRIQELHIIL